VWYCGGLSFDVICVAVIAAGMCNHALLRQIDDVIAQAQAVSSGLMDQRKIIDGVSDKLVQVH
jgi:hypothetical protein